MPPIRTYTDWNKRPSDAEDQREPFKKYFFICEGLNTEVWYFRKLIDMRKQLGIHPMIDIRLMEKTGEDESLSNPKALIEFADKQKQVAANKFDSKIHMQSVNTGTGKKHTVISYAEGKRLFSLIQVWALPIFAGLLTV